MSLIITILVMIFMAVQIVLALAQGGEEIKNAVIEALEEVFCESDGDRINVEIITKKIPSRVSLQPFGEETRNATRNLAQQAMVEKPGADYYLALQDGLFKTHKKYYLQFITHTRDRIGHLEFHPSSKVEVPSPFVRKAERIGFKKTTVARVMAEEGEIISASDPYKDLGSKTPKTELVKEALIELFKKIKNFEEKKDKAGIMRFTTTSTTMTR